MMERFRAVGWTWWLVAGFLVLTLTCGVLSAEAALPRGEQLVELAGPVTVGATWLDVWSDGEFQLVLTMQDRWGNVTTWPKEGDQYYTFFEASPRLLGASGMQIVSADVTLVTATKVLLSWW
jgi:hypothetical protein